MSGKKRRWWGKKKIPEIAILNKCSLVVIATRSHRESYSSTLRASTPRPVSSFIFFSSI
jgi:hypothetical protein